MKKTALRVLTLVVVAAGSTACATKGYVNDGLAEVNAKIETMSGSLEDTQEQTRENAEGVATSRREAAAAGEAAEAAGRSASDANNAALSAGERADAAGANADRMMRLLYEVVLSHDQGNFGFGASTLGDETRGAIDSFASQLKADAPDNIFIEIEGHTDSTGEPLLNEKLGLERAEAVKRYLHDTHQIPLHRMNTISYGEDNPIAPNEASEGRAQNRRVVVRVLS